MAKEKIGERTYRDADGNIISQTTIYGNDDYVMLFNKHWKNIRQITEHYPQGLNTFTMLVELMNRMNSVTVSMKSLEYLLGKSRQTISKHIAYLEANGFIKVIRSNGESTYYINADIFWANTDAKRKFAMLDTNLVMAEPEFHKPEEKRGKEKEPRQFKGAKYNNGKTAKPKKRTAAAVSDVTSYEVQKKILTNKEEQEQ